MAAAHVVAQSGGVTENERFRQMRLRETRSFALPPREVYRVIPRSITCGVRATGPELCPCGGPER
jgi:hypothetical protein